jgi:hypothetical protein
MDLRRLRAGEWIVALSGVALFVSLFLPWFGGGRSAWEALGVTDVVLAVIAATALGLVVATATQDVPAVPIALEAVVTLLGVVAVVLVLVRVISPLDGREWGLWLGLAAAVGIAAGAWLGLRDERVAGAPPPPEVEALPAPRP